MNENNTLATEFQLEIFKRLTDPHGRQTLVKMAMETHRSESTIKRAIKQIKNKIIRTL